MEFGRDLEQEDVNTRVSNFLLARNFSVANVTLYTRYYEKLLNTDPNLFNRLPGASLHSVPLSLGGLPLYLGLSSSYNYFYQNHGMTGDRLDFHPNISLQGQPTPGISFGSQVGFRETVFRVDHAVPDGPQEQVIPRQLFDSRVALSGAWAKDYGRGDESSYFFRHILRPEVSYTNLPRFDPHRYPQFDPLDQGWVAQVNRNLPVREGDDPVGGVNALTYGIGNNILWRSQNEQGQTTVRDILWLRLSQTSFYNKSSMGLDGNSVHHHPFSDFWGEMQFYPLRQLVLGSNVGVSPYKEGFDRADFKVTVLDNQRQNYINLNYVYVKDFAKQINVEAYLNLMRSVKTWVTYGHTFETNNQLEKRYSVVLQRECWGVVLSYTDRPNDQRIGFTVFIPGFGQRSSPIRFPGEGKKQEGPDLF
jgi:LPS-assembly protein